MGLANLLASSKASALPTRSRLRRRLGSLSH